MKKAFIIFLFFLLFWLALPAGILYSSLLIDGVISFSPLERFKNAGIVIMVISFPLLIISVISYKRFTGEFPVSAFPPYEIVQRGIYSIWRHPIYLFFSFLLLGIGLLVKSRSFLLLVFPLYLLILSLYIYSEEKKLTAQYGETYKNYTKRTALVIPQLTILLKIAFYIVFKLLFKYQATGLQNIPKKLPFIIVAAHRNYLDPFFISLSVNFPVYYVATYEVFRNRLLRFFLNKLHAIPKARYRTDIKAIKNVINLLNSNSAVGIFPEGERSWTGKLNTFKTEVLKLIRRFSHIPIVPVKLEGNFYVWPRWAANIRRAKVKVNFLEPLFIKPDDDLEQIEKEIAVHIAPSDTGLFCTSNKLVNNLPIVLYRCPSCFSFESLKIKGKIILKCLLCKTSLTLLPDYSINVINNTNGTQYTLEKLYDIIRIKNKDVLPEPTVSIISDDSEDKAIVEAKNILACREEGKEMITTGYGTLYMTNKEISHSCHDAKTKIAITDITSVTIEGNCKLQLYEKKNRQLYQYAFKNESALKWQDYIIEVLKVYYNYYPNTR